jgi:hypothetical protein
MDKADWEIAAMRVALRTLMAVSDCYRINFYGETPEEFVLEGEQGRQ